MQVVNFLSNFSACAPESEQAVCHKLNVIALFAVAGVCLGMAAPTASASTVSRSVVVPGAPAAVWAMIGPFCAIRDWLPPVGTCTEDGGVPPTRTLVTKDGKATFVERELARSDKKHFYSYSFLSSPLPVTRYSSTIKVAARDDGQSTVTWRGTYTPQGGKEKDAKAALNGIYAAGLDAIRNQAIQRFGSVASKRAKT